MRGRTCLAPTKRTVPGGDMVMQPASQAGNCVWPIAAVDRAEPLDGGDAPDVLGDVV